MDVGAWLCDLGLGQYEKAFRENDIDAGVLPDLTAEDLISLGVTSIGHRRKLLTAIAALRSGSASTASLSMPTQGPLLGTLLPPPEAERRQLAVMFIDLVGSTALAARLDPEDVREVIKAYHRCVADTVRRFGGFVAKYLAMGFWFISAGRRLTKPTPSAPCEPAWLSWRQSANQHQPENG
jgi:class 3 adenylate cyclase